VTFDQSDPDNLKKTAEAIELLNTHRPEMQAGAGTVLSSAQLQAAKSAGAGFIISPNTDVAIINATKSFNLVSIPGAMTPTLQNTSRRVAWVRELVAIYAIRNWFQLKLLMNWKRSPVATPPR